MTYKILYFNKCLFIEHKKNINNNFKIYLFNNDVIEDDFNYYFFDLYSDLDKLPNIIKPSNTKFIGFINTNIIHINHYKLGLDGIYQDFNHFLKSLYPDDFKKKYPINLFTTGFIISSNLKNNNESIQIDPNISGLKTNQPIELFNDSFESIQYIIEQSPSYWELKKRDSNVICFNKQNISIINKKVMVLSKKHIEEKSPYEFTETVNDIKIFLKRINESTFDILLIEYSSYSIDHQKKLFEELTKHLPNQCIYWFNSKKCFSKNKFNFFYKKDINAYFKDMNPKSNHNVLIKDIIKINNISKKEILINTSQYKLKINSLIVLKNPIELLIKVKKIKIINNNEIYLCDIIDLPNNSKKLQHFLEN